MNDDLISRKALAKYFDTKAEAAKKLYDNGAAENTWHSAYEAVIDADAIDAVVVVRCKDCVYKDMPQCCPCQLNGFRVTHDWYCPMGVKEDGHEPD
ncbi:MAG: hypothetical protein IKJ45_15280 [Kiritimatiellae bacterium]|nr:hypothetical protein [Kiritimatiellia bacterium]